MLLPAEDGCDVMISQNRRSLVWVDGGGKGEGSPRDLLFCSMFKSSLTCIPDLLSRNYKLCL